MDFAVSAGATKVAAAGSFEICLSVGTRRGEEISPRGFSHTILPELTAPSVWKGIIYVERCEAS